MGSGASKISDHQKIKLYKRISLLEARRQFSLTNQTLPIFDQPPISRNFSLSISNLPNCRENVYISYHGEFEISGNNTSQNSRLFRLRHILSKKIGIIEENYFVGLSKKQYDALYNQEEEKNY
jgi:hypothetical protein